MYFVHTKNASRPNLLLEILRSESTGCTTPARIPIIFSSEYSAVKVEFLDDPFIEYEPGRDDEMALVQGYAVNPVPCYHVLEPSRTIRMMDHTGKLKQEHVGTPTHRYHKLGE